MMTHFFPETFKRRRNGSSGERLNFGSIIATRLCKTDLHVFAKLFEDCLKRCLEAQAFSRREISVQDDVWISSSDTLSMSF